MIAARAAQKPGGKVSEVIGSTSEQQGAYDFLESKHVNVEALISSMGCCTAEQCSREQFAFVAVDGSSLTLSDHGRKKDFGSIGTLEKDARGLKVISALAVSPAGVPLGLLDQRWWARTGARHQEKKGKRKRNWKRRVGEKETRYWLEAVARASTLAKEAGAELWFQLDREADNKDILLALAQSGHRYTVRGAWDRLVESTGEGKEYLRALLGHRAPQGQYELKVPGGPKRKSRLAKMLVRVAAVTLRLRDQWNKTEKTLSLNVVWAREDGTTPPGEKPLDWLLLTSAPVDTMESAMLVVRGYAQRWRIEDFHKSWKSGGCRVEETQLHDQHAVTIWATLLAAVAVRAERIKLLARETPEEPADTELSRHEIRALILLRRQNNHRDMTPLDEIPNLNQATLWIAELGGYTGKSSGGPPGAITIRRGLERLQPAADVLRALDQQ